MKKRYEWRELTDDGLVKKPDDVGHYYSSSNVNTYGGFASEEEAIAAYTKFKSENKWGLPYELVLVCFYRPDDT